MKNAARLGDQASDRSRAIAASLDVFVNMLGWVRMGDRFGAPCNNDVMEASKSVFANGIGVARIGDRLRCNATIIEGSPDTFAGD